LTPTLAPMARGILATCTARLTEPGRSDPGTGPLRDALRAAYDGEPFVHVLPEGRWPATGATLGSNAAHLQVAADPHAGRAVVVCALDNLVKGAAGQAIQIANLMLSLPETAGLTAYGVSP
jgi:N-acetyl-gamma-glutamyl-phosphate reductase